MSRPDTGRRLAAVFLVTVLAAVPIVSFLPFFFQWIGAKPGILPPDPLLDIIPPRDVSRPLFLLLYATIALCVASLVPRPVLLLRGLQAYLLLLLLRMASMALLTLEPPPEMVTLHDPVTAHFYPGREPFAKDLFFSGHTATVFLLFLVSPWRIAKGVLLAVTILVGAAVIAQHAHWTIDVLAAPFFAWLAWRGSRVTMCWAGLPPGTLREGDRGRCRWRSVRRGRPERASWPSP